MSQSNRIIEIFEIWHKSLFARDSYQIQTGSNFCNVPWIIDKSFWSLLRCFTENVNDMEQEKPTIRNVNSAALIGVVDTFCIENKDI